MTVRGRLALIGAGNLGAAVVERLLAEGHALTVCDRDEMKLGRLKAKGAETTVSAADCAAQDVILVIVATDTQLREVADQLAATRRDAPGYLAVMSTVPAEAVRQVAEALAPSGFRVVDAPVSGGADRALSGTLTIMAGGAAEDIAALSPVFDAIAANIFRCGDVGAGQAVKIVNNIICHANTTLTAEAFRLGMAHGLRPEDFARVLEVSTGRNWLTATPTLAAETLAHHTSDRATYDGILSILKKDMAIAASLAGAQEAYPMISGVATLIERLGDETWETWRAVAAEQRLSPTDPPPSRRRWLSRSGGRRRICRPG